MDGRRSSPSSSLCTTTTVVVFVALCLVGAWMMTSSTIFPLEITSNKKAAVKEQPARVNYGASEEAAAASGNSAEGVDRFGDTDNNDNAVPEEPNKTVPSEEEKFSENTVEKPVESSEEKAPPKEKEESKDTFDDANGKTEQSSAKEDGDSESGSGQSDGSKNGDDEEKSEEKKDDEQSDGERKDDQEEKAEGSGSKDTTDQPQIEETVDESGEKGQGAKSNEVFPDGAQSELLKESNTENGSFKTQDAESKNEKESQAASNSSDDETTYNWKLCNNNAGTDYIPCLDNEKAIKKLRTTKHYEHRERHCPVEPPTCVVPLPEGYKRPVEWPTSRDKVILYFYDVFAMLNTFEYVKAYFSSQVLN